MPGSVRASRNSNNARSNAQTNERIRLPIAMIDHIQEVELEQPAGPESTEALPFPFNQQTFCRYEPVERTIERARVLVIDDLLRDERDISEVAQTAWGEQARPQLRREREIASLAIENILSNVARLVKEPATRVAHISEIAAAVNEFEPDA